jgi:hypothetical protein
MNKNEPKLAKFEVFHAMGDFFWTSLHYGWECTPADILEALHDGRYELVATFELVREDLDFQLEHIYRITNNVEDSWREISPCRSTSVGDVVKVDDDVYVVAARGYDHIDEHGVVRSTAIDD